MIRVFSADSITRSFGSRAILKAASIWASEGRVTVLFGQNGAGKSTLLKIGTGLLRADQGVIEFLGRPYQRPQLHELARQGLFYLPDRDLLSRRLRVRDQIRSMEWRFGSSRTAEILERLQVEGVIDRRPVDLSGGERRRVEIAAAWIRAPRCLLADEPFLGIDPSDAEVVAAVIRQMAREGCAMILTGHDVPQLIALADEVAWMTAGTTHGLGSAEQALRHDQFRREYLGTSAMSRDLTITKGDAGPSRFR